MHRFVIDTDIGVDDAIAIMMALRHPDVQVEAITTVAGNVGVEHATRNALYVAELCGAGVPVYRGMARPMLRELSNAESVHGKDGLGDLDREPPQGRPQAEHAVDALIRHVTAAPGEITVVALGPLTNLGMALLKEPAFAQTVKEIVLMGGAANALGNVTPSAEFNIWADPDAAKLVFHCGAPVIMAGWELVWGEMMLTPDEMARLRASGAPCAVFAMDCTTKIVALYKQLFNTTSLAMPDPIAMAVAIDRRVCRAQEFYVTVETESDLTRGETVVDRFGVLGQPPNVAVCLEPDAARFKQMIFDTLT